MTATAADYKFYDGQKNEVESRIQRAEARHFNLTIDKKIAESLDEPEELLDISEELLRIDITLKTLYDV